MRLSDFDNYNTITIQCHDNPDADALGAGYGLYCYFLSKGKDVHLVYSGRNTISKANLKLMVEKLDIPIEYIPPDQLKYVEGLLITVDCQYGSGNVTKIEAEQVAVIDHHPLETKDTEHLRIQSNLGSCATLVWIMLREEGYLIKEDMNLGTALYYGLYSDTNQFAELSNPLDMDMRESVSYNKSMLTLFRNSNLSLRELEIAGVALIRYNYNEDYHFAVIKALPCDPNILGLISDFLLQVDEINTCAVYNEGADGFKLSVRSCIKEVKANELAAYLTQDIGSGGGHYEKAGGFISKMLYEKKYPAVHSEAYFNNRMTEYFESFEIVYARDIEINVQEMVAYQRVKVPMGYVKASDFLKAGASISIRNQECNIDLVVDDEMYFTIESDGTVHSMGQEIFQKYHMPTEEHISTGYYEKTEYIPNIKDWTDGSTYLLTDCVKICIPKDEFCIYAKKLDKCVKVFAKWDNEKYLLGMPGDYLAVNVDDLHNVFIEPGYDFLRNYEQIEL